MNHQPNQDNRDGRALITAAVGAGIGLGSTSSANPRAPAVVGRAAAHELPPLPYADDALAPAISKNTIGFHYGKHHAGYVAKLNELLKGSDLADLKLEELIAKVACDKDKAAIFNNAAQIWNHTFYWRSLKPGGGGKPTGKLAELVNKSRGFDKFSG